MTLKFQVSFCFWQFSRLKPLPDTADRDTNKCFDEDITKNLEKYQNKIFQG